MDEAGAYSVSTEVLIGALVVLLTLSAFFSGTETALMSVNRYRLRHEARSGRRAARLAESLLQRPDRLLGLILLGNNAINIAASMLTTLIALRVGGDFAVPIAGALLVAVLLVFAEVAPKTVAALHPSRVALPASYVYVALLKIWPVRWLVWLVNAFANNLLRLLGVDPKEVRLHSLNSEELRTVVSEAGALIPRRHQQMLIGILDLEKATVDDIMVPRNEIVGIDLEDDWSLIREQLDASVHTRLPLFRGDLDSTIGMLHLRKLIAELSRGDLNPERLVALADDAYFVPEGTALNRQLLNFQAARQRIGLVVDEYGDIQGLVTLEDILEEVVGEFTTDPASAGYYRDVHSEGNGRYLVNGSANVRMLNRMMRWKLPTDGPKTLNGLITEYLETIPKAGTSLELSGYPLEIVQTTDNAIKTVRVSPPGDT